MNKGTALTLMFGTILVGALVLSAGVRNRSLSEILKGETEPANATVASGEVGASGGVNAPAPTSTGSTSNTPFQNQASNAGATPGSGGTAAEKALVKDISKTLGWNASAWEDVIEKESGWNSAATNPTSGAYGIGQFLGSTKTEYRAYGSESPEAKKQIEAMAVYIQKRYGNPTAALAFHNTHNYY
jgi:hypothetical protein